MGDKIRHALFILMRLYHNQAGNTLAIVAAAIFPLAALIGGGVDMSRLYLTKTRLQQACDAGALAGRRAMTGLTWTTGAGSTQDTANRFFTINFPANKYGTRLATITYSANSAGAVTGNASVVVPMTLMSLFQMPDKTVTADCTADLQLPNTDVMFVLDTTGSMLDPDSGGSTTKIAGLRSAVTNFYNQLEAVKPAGSTIRYGFVPYSSTVNVGMLLKREWIQDNPVYDSRTPGTPTTTTTTTTTTQPATLTSTNTVTTSGNFTTSTFPGQAENCVAPANSNYTDVYSAWSAYSPSATASPRTRSQTRTRNGTTYSASTNSSGCTITATTYNNFVQTVTQTVTNNPDAGQQTTTTTTSTVYNWNYGSFPYSVAALKGTASNGLMAGGSFSAQVANNYANRTITWNSTNACIEERKTRRTDEGTNIPRYDMDVDLVPNSADPDTQWKPYLPGLVYARGANSATATTGWIYNPITSSTNYYTPFGNTAGYVACPSPARKLGTITSAALTTYLNSLAPVGYTYHDIGMLWGLRLMSRDGIFAAENQAAEATGKVARHIIFMTDGDTETRNTAYDAWGVSVTARRRTPTSGIPANATQDGLTESRLLELCSVAKDQKNITVWVIAFGTTLTQLLTDCGSPGRAYQANNAAELNAAFSQIASQIASLRLTR
ncbi:pilus assembly protein [Sphingobium mellinum]|uniref:pilus assembly protein n=1 Tax=Sphingobium mellinum TaxID=1387166 RepID=UPI0030EC3485